MDLWFKVNVDGAIFAQSQTMGISFLLRDFAGRVEAMLSKSLPVLRGGNSCSRVRLMLCQLMNIRLYKSTLTQHVY